MTLKKIKILSILLILNQAYLWTICPVSTNQGPIRILFLGRAGGWGEPYWLLRRDPMFTFVYVQAEFRTDFSALSPIQAASTEEAVRRLVRIYMPRTYADLSSRIDVMVFWHANRFAFNDRNIQMMARGIEEGGIGMLMFGGWESFGGSSHGPPWGDTSVGRLLPTEDTLGGWIDDGQFVIDDEDNEFIRSLPWEPTPNFNVRGTCHHNIVTVKPGADLLAHLVNRFQPDHPGMVTWKLDGGSRVFAFTVEAFHFYYWEYFTDLGANLAIYIDGRPVPQDLELVHMVRGKVSQISTTRSLLMGLVEFCESFWANTGPIMVKVDEVEAAMAEATPLYLELRLLEAMETFDSVDEMVKEVEVIAIDVKNRALFWVYLVEWLVVRGTLMTTGFVLWTVMIRRRFYRRMRASRFV